MWYKSQSAFHLSFEGEARGRLLRAEAAREDALPVQPADVVDAGGAEAALPVQRARRGGLPPEGALGRRPAQTGMHGSTSKSTLSLFYKGLAIRDRN